MGYVVHLRNNATGEIRECVYEADWGDGSLYNWTEGNYSCDCNRADLFNGSQPFDADEKCGHTRFTALYADLPDGTRVQLDNVTESE